MKKALKRILFEFIYFILLFAGGKNYSNKQFNPFTLLQFFFYQKILRINSKINWPVHRTSKVISPKRIIKGSRNPGMAMGCYIDGRNGIQFGNNVWIGPKVSIISMNHNLYEYEKYEESEPIIIGDDCWLATGCIILPGVKLGNHVIVAAGAVVTKSFNEDNIVIGGNPAKKLKNL